PRRTVITGMAVNTPLGDTLDGFLAGLLEGRSAITHWKKFADAGVYSRIGAALSDYDVPAKVRSWEPRLPEPMFRVLKRFAARAPWSTKLSLLIALDAYADAGLLDREAPASTTGVLVAGHNINLNYQYENRAQFVEE